MNKKYLKSLASKINIQLNEKEINKFELYMEQLLDWNKRINLTAIVREDDIILKHFIDSMTILKYISNSENVIDVGTGAGFPGIPVSIVKEDCQVTLVDSLNKRINFLNEVIEKLKLEDIETIHSRIEDLGQDKNHREKYDLVLCRALSSVRVLAEYTLPLTIDKGWSLYYKGPKLDEELTEASNAFKILGVEPENIEIFRLLPPEIPFERINLMI